MNMIELLGYLDNRIKELEKQRGHFHNSYCINNYKIKELKKIKRVIGE